MTTKRDRIRIETYPPSDKGRSAIDRLAVTNDAVMHLARLIGRQMAREDFDRKQASERRGPVMPSEK